MRHIDNINISDIDPLITPRELKEKLPASDQNYDLVASSREEIRAIIRGEDPRLLVVIGPCSLHDVKAAREYASRLAQLRETYRDKLAIVMRTYFEKPRTTTGWKGLINDPDLNESSNINKGLEISRRLLLDILNEGLPVACEMLDTLTPQYYADLVSWGSIGARTTESQPHREMSSGLSMPVGFKNGTDGNVLIAINAIQSSQSEHHFLGLNADGKVSIFRTTGNPDGHIILRGGLSPNYSAAHVAKTVDQLKTLDLNPRLLIDCSHGNSNKDHRNQHMVIEDIIAQIKGGSSSILGVMIESHLQEGKQKFPQALENLQYGVSITDACVGWDETERLLKKLATEI